MNDRESIRQSLIAYLEDDLGETISSLEDEVNIREGLGLDSVDVVGLVMQVERQFWHGRDAPPGSWRSPAIATAPPVARVR